MAEIAQNYAGCSVTLGSASLGIDCTGNCSTVTQWCSSTNSYASILNCSMPGNGGVLWDDGLAAGGKWATSFDGSAAASTCSAAPSALIFGAPTCVTLEIGYQSSPAYYVGSLIDNQLNVTGPHLETLVGTLDPVTMTITGTDVSGPIPVQSVPFTACKVP
jgi:hypothetical protein